MNKLGYHDPAAVKMFLTLLDGWLRYTNREVDHYVYMVLTLRIR